MKSQLFQGTKFTWSLVLLPSIVMLILAYFTHVFVQTDIMSSTATMGMPARIGNSLVFSWFFVGVLVSSLQILYAKKQLAIGIVLFIATVIAAYWMIGVPDYEHGYGIFPRVMVNFLSGFGYILGLMAMLAIVKPELKRQQFDQMPGQELALLLIPFFGSWLVFGSYLLMSNFTSSQISIWVIVTSAIAVGSYAVVSGWWGHLPLSTIVITALSLCLILPFGGSSYENIFEVVGGLLIEFIVIFSGVYFGKRYYNKK